MDARTAKFLIFLVFGLVCFGLGVWLRRSRPGAERFAPPVHLYTVLYFWTPVVLIGFWNLRIDAQLYYFFVLQPLLMIVAALLTLAATRTMKLPSGGRGDLVLAGGLSNVGFAMGAYLCYVLFADGQQAFAYGITVLTVMQVTMYLVFYPVADHYGPDAGRSLLHTIRSSLINIRALPIHVVPLGIALNLGGVPFPRAIVDWYLLDLFFFLGAGGGYLGIGLNFRLRLPDRRDAGAHTLIFFMKFLATPIIAYVLVRLTMLAGLAPSSMLVQVFLLEAAMPVAISASIISNLFDLDGELASDLWFYNTLLFCIGPLWAVVWIFHGAT